MANGNKRCTVHVTLLYWDPVNEFRGFRLQAYIRSCRLWSLVGARPDVIYSRNFYCIIHTVLPEHTKDMPFKGVCPIGEI
jgi:hypothetical protein